MKKFYSTSDIPKIKIRLKKEDMSLYKISTLINEPKTTVAKVFNPDKYKYSKNKINQILTKITEFLDGYGNKPNSDSETLISVNPELSLKLFKLGLDSKSFTPDEKLQLALAHKKLTESKNEKSKQDEEAA